MSFILSQKQPIRFASTVRSVIARTFGVFKHDEDLSHVRYMDIASKLGAP
jgi:hypothetical protein